MLRVAQTGFTILRTAMLLLFLLLLVSAGIFCYQGAQMASEHCEGAAGYVWCGDIFTHGSIISGAVLPILMIFSTVLLLLYSVPLSSKIVQTIYLVARSTVLSTTRYTIPLVHPIQLALAQGIIHPRIP